jgi:hypothetical protein
MALIKINNRSSEDTAIHGRRNLIINGAMQVAQRGVSTSITHPAGGAHFSPDRFEVGITATDQLAATLSQSTTAPDGFSNSLKFEVTTAETTLDANELVTIRQKIEGQDLQRIAKGTSSAEQVTASFWVRSSNTGTYILELYDLDNTRQVSKSYTINSANTWEYKTITFPADTTGAFDNDNNLSLYFMFWLAAGSDFTSGTLNTSWASETTANRVVGQANLIASTNDFYITGIQLEVGSVATEFDHRSFAEELALCQRYFFNPLFGRTSGAIYYPIHFNQVSTGNNGLLRWQVTFPVSMRTSPTLTHSLTDAKFQTSAPNGTDNWAFYKQNSGWASKVGNSDISVLNIAPSVNQANVGAYYVTPSDTLATAIGIGGGATFNFSSEL